MKKLILLLALTLTSTSQAATQWTEINYRNTDEAYLHAALGFVSPGAHYLDNENVTPIAPLSGFIGLGADYEHMLDYDLGLIGAIRYYSTTDSLTSSNVETTLSVFSVGAQLRFHIPFKSWDLYASPGLGFTSATIKVEDEDADSGLVITPTFALGVMYAVSDDYSVGVENMRIVGLGTKLNGEIISDYMIKGRFSF